MLYVIICLLLVLGLRSCILYRNLLIPFFFLLFKIPSLSVLHPCKYATHYSVITVYFIEYLHWKNVAEDPWANCVLPPMNIIHIFIIAYFKVNQTQPSIWWKSFTFSAFIWTWKFHQTCSFSLLMLNMLLLICMWGSFCDAASDCQWQAQ